MEEAIRAYFAERREEILAEIAGLTALPSTADRPDAVAQALERLLALCGRLGMRTGKASRGDSGWAEMGQGTETVGILSHVDVVGIGDRDKWTGDPFRMRRQDGRLYGRGVLDDKGPAVISVYAAHALTALGAPVRKRIRLIFGTSEETDWTDMAHYRQEFGAPDCGFSPDGSFPIFNVERGYLDVTLRFRDPALAGLRSLDAGDSPNTVPSLARLETVSGETRIWQGRSVHSSRPQLGDNAIVRMAEALAPAGWRWAAFVREYLNGDWCGEKLGLSGDDTWQGEKVGKTSLCPTVLHLRGDTLVMNVNVRVRCGIRPEEVTAAFAAKGAEYGFTAEGKAEAMPELVPSTLPFLQHMNRAYEATGRPGGFYPALGASYAQCMPRCVAWGPDFPGTVCQAHMEDEWVSEDALLEAGEIYARFLQAYCAG